MFNEGDVLLTVCMKFDLFCYINLLNVWLERQIEADCDAL